MSRLVAGLAAWAVAPSPHHPEPPVPCAVVAERIIGLIEDNYAGFPDKTAGSALATYRTRTDSLRQRARALPSHATVTDCHDLLLDWISIFRDGHLNVTVESDPTAATATVTPQVTREDIRARFAAVPRRSIQADDTLRAQRPPAMAGSLRGVWRTLDGAYRLLGQPAAHATTEFLVLEADSVWWLPGQQKGALVRDAHGAIRGEYRLRDHTPRQVTGRLTGNVLQLFATSDSSIAPIILLRDAPRTAGDVTPASLASERGNTLQFRRLSAHTVLLGMPSFRPDVADSIIALLALHRAELQRTPNLIIDVRGNGGGLDYVYRPLLELIATGPITSAGVSFRSTPANISVISEYATSTEVRDSAREFLRTLLDSMRAHPGDFVSTRGEVDSSFRNRPAPRRVAILVDRGCASSCEQFLLDARQSRKVRLYGQPSAGVLDYSNVVPRPVDGTPFTVHIPLTRSDRLPANPVDPDGIAAHVRIAREVVLPITWIRQQMESRRGWERRQ